MYFDVHIPTNNPGGLESRLQVQARDWRQAMEASARHRGIDWKGFAGTFVEVGENGSRIVTDTRSRTQFVIRQIQENDARISQVLQASDIEAAAEDNEKKKEKPRQPSGQIRYRAPSGQHVSITATDTNEFEVQDSGRVLSEHVGRSQSVETEEAQADGDAGAISETALEDAFLEIPTIFEPGYAMPDAIDFVLDLAKKYIPSSHAGILFTKETGDALYFAAARGKGSKKMLETDIPMDNGIISRSLRNGSAFSVADPVSDARYDPTFTKVTGIKVDSLLCAPIQKGPRVFGVLTMMNRDGRDDFHQYDVNVASYLGNQLGEYIQRQFDQQPLN